MMKVTPTAVPRGTGCFLCGQLYPSRAGQLLVGAEAKHGVHFERTATVFLDPLAITIPDDEHSETEVRWITLGMDAGG